MSKYKYQKQVLFSTRKLQEIELFLEGEDNTLDLLNIRDGKKNTVIHHCSYLNQHRHIEFYIKYYRKSLEKRGFTVTEIKNQTRILLDQKNIEGYAAAHYAAFRGNITILKLLSKYEANLSLKSNLGMSLLHLAAQGDKINTILYLHGREFDINQTDIKGSTPLHWASYTGSEKIVQYLLVQPEIILDCKDQEGHTPLHIAVAYGFSKIVKKLLIAGSNRKITNLKGQTPLQIAQQNQFDKIRKMLDDRYTFLDYLKFICNAKVKYIPRKRSLFQPLIFYFVTAIIAFLSYGIITVNHQILFYFQSAIYAITFLLFTSLIFPPQPHIKAYTFNDFSDKQNIYKLCMQCLRTMKDRQYHCTTCRICVSQYDHHCFWINNCVGKSNLFRFNLFIFITQVSLCWVGYLTACTLLMIYRGEQSTGVIELNQWIVKEELAIVVKSVCILIAVIVGLFAFPLICLILIQFKNLLLGKTTYQRFTKNNQSVLTRQGSDFLGKSWQGNQSISLKNCYDMCFQQENQQKQSQSNSTTSSFIREH